MKKNLIILSIFVLALVLVASPVGVFAQVPPTTTTTNQSVTVTGTTGSCSNTAATTKLTNIGEVFCLVSGILNAVIPVMIALGVVFFIFGVVSYVIANDEEAKKKGRNRIIYGIIRLAVILSVWGHVRIFTGTFQLDNSSSNRLPTVPYR